MKKIKLLCLLIFTLSFTKCASLPSDTKPPFTITNAMYQNWTGGVRGVSGTNVTINYTSEKEIEFKELFFKGEKRKISLKETKNGEKILFVKFNKKNKFNDLQLHADPKKEFGNNPSKEKIDLPFELKNTEAALSYMEGNKIKYFKIENIKKGQQITLQ